LARLPFLPAPGSTTNLTFSTLVCNASPAELIISSLICSHLLYQIMCNVSEKVGLASPISQRVNGHKNCVFDTFLSIFFLHSAVSSQLTHCQVSIYRFLHPYIVPILIDGEPARKGGISSPGVAIAIKSSKYASCPSCGGCVIWKANPEVILLNAAWILRSRSSDVLFSTKQDLREHQDGS
jgi:hypothetical protein